MTTPTNDEELVAIPEIITEQTINSAIAIYDPVRAGIAELQKRYSGLKISGPEDKATYAIVAEGISTLRTLRNRVEKRRKEINDAPLKLQRKNNEVAKEITAQLTPLEDYLKQEKARIDEEKEALKRAEEMRRIKLLQEAGFQLSGQFYICGPHMLPASDLAEIQIELLEKHITDAKAWKLQEEARKAEEAARAKAEAERQQAEAKRLAEEREAMQRERYAMRSEIMQAKGFALTEGGMWVHPENQMQVMHDSFVLTSEKASFDAQLALKVQMVSAPAPQVSAPAPQATAPVRVPVATFAYASPQAAPVAQQAKPAYHNDGTSSWENGWEACRTTILAYWHDGQPRTRAQWIELITNVKP